jgi:hypothetical protein
VVTFEIESVMALSECLHLVSLVWFFRAADGGEIYHATTRYVMRRSDSGLKIKSRFVVNK